MFGTSAISQPTLPAVGLYAALEKTRDRQFAQFVKQPTVAREVAYFKENIGNVKSLDDFTKNYRLMKFALTAFQLEEKSDAPGFMKKILGQSLDDDESFVNRMIDPRFKDMAKAFDFAGQGVARLSDPAVINKVVDGYLTNEFEKYMGNSNPAMREAMYFKRMAGGVKNAYQILANKVILSVVQTTLGLPKEMAYLKVEKQAQMIEKKLDVAKLSDPRFVDTFIRRFVAQSDLQSSQAALGPANMVSLIQPLSANPFLGNNVNLSV